VENSFKGECEKKAPAINFAGLFNYNELSGIKNAPMNRGHNLKTKPV